ncbi:MAG: hypothetical protein QF807_03675 [Candidatus Thalassarchaeaceae archaeon]|nr:hypothetical protein [Candidatus Thalassarchaeaceae archaeon]MDP7043097.1 hypothetical protein [Candidatus Thalassarchaeaceae archaeon]
MGRAVRKSGQDTLTLMVCLLLLSPIAIALPEALTTGNASAASNCSYESKNAAEWHREVSSFNLSGSSNDDYYAFDEENGDSMAEPFWDMGMGDNIYNSTDLDALRSDFHASFEVKNDSASGLRLNLTTDYRYTFCIVTHSENSSEYLEAPLVDFYLIQEFDWDLYRTDFSMRFWEDKDMLNMIPPQWRIGSWMPYRDVHAYEGERAVDFSVSLDHDETSGALFGLGDEQTQWMYLIVDGWGNMRDTNTPAPHRNFTVDISIMTEERLTLPNFTVSCVCCGLFSLLIAAPVILHSRFQSAGVDSHGIQGVDLMPMLETEATKGAPPPPPT